MAIARDFPQANANYGAPGCHDLPALKRLVNEGTPDEYTEVLTRYTLSREDIQYINKNAAIWITTAHGIYPMAVYCEPMFKIEPDADDLPRDEKPYVNDTYYYIGTHMISLWGKNSVQSDDGHVFIVSQACGSSVSLTCDKYTCDVVIVHKVDFKVTGGYQGRVESLEDFMRIFELSKPLT